MTYTNLRLAEDMYHGNDLRDLTVSEVDELRAVRNPRLQADLYDSLVPELPPEEDSF